jgi:AraC-like DNA-binding protein
LLRPEALLWKQTEVNGDWAFRFPANSGTVFTMVARGRCVFQTADREPREMREGDFLLMRAPPSWTLGRDEASTPHDFVPLHSRTTAKMHFRDNKVQTTRILGGHFVFEKTNASLLDNLLPSHVEINSLDEGSARLRRILDLLGDEALGDRPGRGLVMERLLELMLVEAIRTRAASSDHVDGGLIAGLRDMKVAKALRAMHADIRRKWTVIQLADVAGMSRSVFAERFDRVVGLSPIDYLHRWRMALAKDALHSGKASLSEIAQQTGYLSVSAFSTAFTRTIGSPPSSFAQRRARDQSGKGH